MSDKQINDGGPAFPLKEPVSSDAAGTSLRDCFAMKAMQSLLATIDTYPDERWRDGLAIEAYRMADAMLKAREAR